VNCKKGTFNKDGTGPCVELEDGYRCSKILEDDANNTDVQGETGCSDRIQCDGALGQYRQQENENECKIAPPGQQVQGQETGNNYTSSGAIYAINCTTGTYNTNGLGKCGDVLPGHQGQKTDSVGGTHAASGAIHPVNCKKGTFNNDGTGPCVELEAGYRCSKILDIVANNTDVQGETGCSERIQCDGALGQYRQQENENECDIAPPGQQVQGQENGNDYTASGAIYAINCTTGTYNNDGTGACTNATAGYYVASTGQSGETACPAGTYNIYCGAPSSSYCTVCSAGKYSPDTARTADCDQLCSAGTYLSDTTTASKHNAANDCTVCGAGKYSIATGRTTDCDECIAGTYLIDATTDATNHDDANDCTVCGAGKYSESTGRPTDCDECIAGTYLSDATTDATNHDDANDCTVCGAGKYSNSTGRHNDCDFCIAGTYISDTDTATNHDQESDCITCPAMSITDTGINDGAAACTPCRTHAKYGPKFWSSESNVPDCLPCRFGYNNDDPAMLYTCTDASLETRIVTHCGRGRPFYQIEPDRHYCYQTYFDLNNNKGLTKESAKEADSEKCEFQTQETLFDFSYTGSTTNHDSDVQWRPTHDVAVLIGIARVTFDLTNFNMTQDHYNYYSKKANNVWDITPLTAKEATNNMFYKRCYFKPEIKIDETTGTATYVRTKRSDWTDQCTFVTDVEGDEIANFINGKKGLTKDGASVFSKTFDIQIDEHVHQVLGVASTCGKNGDGHSSIDDIFSWSNLRANIKSKATITYKLSRNKYGNYTFGHNFEVTNEIDVYDLLYIAGNHYTEAKHVYLDSRPSAATFATVTYIGNQNGLHVQDNDLSATCKSELTIDSSNGDSRHCAFTDDDHRVHNTAANINYTAANIHYNEFHNLTFESTTHKACRARMDVECFQPEPVIEIRDTRNCYHKDHPGCNGETPFAFTVHEFEQTIKAESQIIEAIRLRDYRSYPSNIIGVLNTKEQSKFRCLDETCTQDPYIVLAERANDVSKLKCPLTGKKNGTEFAGNATVVLDRGCGSENSSCYNPDIVVATCYDSVTIHNNNVPADVSTEEKWVYLVKPSEIYPQFYVYGLTTFTRTWSGGTIDATIGNQTYVNDHNNGTESESAENNATKYAPFANSTSRRLLGRRGRRLKLHRRPAPSFEEESITLFVTIPSHETTVK